MNTFLFRMANITVLNVCFVIMCVLTFSHQTINEANNSAKDTVQKQKQEVVLSRQKRWDWPWFFKGMNNTTPSMQHNLQTSQSPNTYYRLNSQPRIKPQLHYMQPASETSSTIINPRASTTTKSTIASSSTTATTTPTPSTEITRDQTMDTTTDFVTEKLDNSYRSHRKTNHHSFHDLKHRGHSRTTFNKQESSESDFYSHKRHPPDERYLHVEKKESEYQHFQQSSFSSPPSSRNDDEDFDLDEDGVRDLKLAAAKVTY